MFLHRNVFLVLEALPGQYQPCNPAGRGEVPLALGLFTFGRGLPALQRVCQGLATEGQALSLLPRGYLVEAAGYPLVRRVCQGLATEGQALSLLPQGKP